MEEIDLKYWKPLKYFANTKRYQISKDKDDDTYEIKKDVEEKLVKIGLIDFSEKSEKLHDEEYVLTIQGYSYFHTLKEINRKDWVRTATIGAWIVSIIALLKSFGILDKIFTK